MLHKTNTKFLGIDDQKFNHRKKNQKISNNQKRKCHQKINPLKTQSKGLSIFDYNYHLKNKQVMQIDGNTSRIPRRIRSAFFVLDFFALSLWHSV